MEGCQLFLGYSSKQSLPQSWMGKPFVDRVSGRRGSLAVLNFPARKLIQHRVTVVGVQSVDSTGTRILLVDDEASIRRALRPTLAELGFQVTEASRGEEGIQLLRAGAFDIVLLDINMPGIGGMAALKRMRSMQPRLPVLILSVRDEEAEKVAALELGADDYVTKPFSTRELIARIRATVRRTQEPSQFAGTSHSIGDIQIAPEQRSVTKGGKSVHLTRKEYEILSYLMSKAGRVVTHRQLLTAVWGGEYCDSNDYLRTFVRQLRKKIEDDPSNPRYLLTHAYVGYLFNDSHGTVATPTAMA